MDECEMEARFEAVLIDADHWWDNLEPEERVEVYVDVTHKKSSKEGGK